MAFPLSVLILAKNESLNIERCVRAVGWCDDVVVVDDGSTDDTVELAESCGARVVRHKFTSFAEQRNWGMEHANLKNEWVLHLDADEVVTSELQAELVRQLSIVTCETVAFRMCRKTIFQDQWLKYSDGFPVWIMRLVRRGGGQFQNSGHGEVPIPSVSGKLGTIRSPFLHFAFSRGIEDWISRHNRYSTREALRELELMQPLRASELLSADKATRRNALRAASRRLPFRAPARFVYQYFLKLGFLDGRAGLVFCYLMATYEAWIVLKRREMSRAGGGASTPAP